jgi:hypothetical protein
LNAREPLMAAFEVWHARIDVEDVVAAAPTRKTRAEAEEVVAKARQPTSMQALSKLTTVRDCRRVILGRLEAVEGR